MPFKSQKWSPDTLNWSYRWLLVTHCMSSGNLILVHWKSSQYSLYLRNSISSPLICFFDTILCKIWAPTSQKMCVAIVFDFT